MKGFDGRSVLTCCLRRREFACRMIVFWYAEPVVVF